MAQEDINNGDSGASARGKINTMFDELYKKREWDIFFDEILTEVQTLHEEETTINSVIKGNAVTVEYSINDGSAWIEFTTSITRGAGTTTLWRVTDFGSYTNGTITIKGEYTDA